MRRSAFFIGALALACHRVDRASPEDLVGANAPSDAASGTDATLIDTGTGPCGEPLGGDFCGQIFLREVDDPPNLYFVIDRSGSMGEPFEGSVLSKYQAAHRIIAELLHGVGHRVRYGAAVFPSFRSADSCEPGEQIFATKRGDPAACAAAGEVGPILLDLSVRLGATTPNGPTPTAATLDTLYPTLTDLAGDTTVILLTDGAPNCNLEASCDASSCTLSIERAELGTTSCSPSFNCCDPALFGDSAGGYCIDDDASEEAIRALHEAGIETYVVGMPGAEPYADFLEQLAIAGGTARAEPPLYYAVADAAELSAALHAIGTGVAIRCAIDLEEPPEDPARVNVYFDGELVPSDATDGWTFAEETRIEVHGAACDRLSSGEVLEARAVFGCETVVR